MHVESVEMHNINLNTFLNKAQQATTSFSSSAFFVANHTQAHIEYACWTLSLSCILHLTESWFLKGRFFLAVFVMKRKIQVACICITAEEKHGHKVIRLLWLHVEALLNDANIYLLYKSVHACYRSILVHVNMFIFWILCFSSSHWSIKNANWNGKCV